MAETNAIKEVAENLEIFGKIWLGEGHPLYEELDDDVKQWVPEAKESIKDELSPYDVIPGVHVKLPQLLSQLREYVLTHQWDEAIEILVVISGERSPLVGPVLHGMTAAIQYNQTDGKKAHAFALGMKDKRSRPSLNFMKVVYETMLYLISNEDTAVVRQFLTSIETKLTTFRIQYADRELQHWENLMTGYRGMLYYLDWKKAKAEQQDQEEEPKLFYDSNYLTEQMNDKIEGYANKALEYMVSVVEKPGIFDIFVGPQIEMLVDLARHNEAERILESYVEKNPDNPWPKERLYKLYGSDSEEKKFKLLQDICEHDPSTSLSLDLFIHLVKQGLECLHVLFEYLLYPVNMNDPNVWILLSDQLLEWTKKGEDIEKYVPSSWTPFNDNRSLQYLFSKYNLLQTNQDVLECKIAAGYILFYQGSKSGKEHLSKLDEVVTKQNLNCDKITTARELSKSSPSFRKRSRSDDSKSETASPRKKKSRRR